MRLYVTLIELRLLLLLLLLQFTSRGERGWKGDEKENGREMAGKREGEERESEGVEYKGGEGSGRPFGFAPLPPQKKFPSYATGYICSFVGGCHDSTM